MTENKLEEGKESGEAPKDLLDLILFPLLTMRLFWVPFDSTEAIVVESLAILVGGGVISYYFLGPRIWMAVSRGLCRVFRNIRLSRRKRLERLLKSAAVVFSFLLMAYVAPAPSQGRSGSGWALGFVVLWLLLTRKLWKLTASAAQLSEAPRELL